MLLKTFQVVLVTFLVIFTAAGAVFLISAVAPLFFPVANTGSASDFSFAFAVTVRTLRIVGAMAVFVGVAVVYLIARRSRLR
jgi:uncharacterized protein YjeT (DUF2065 family)